MARRAPVQIIGSPRHAFFFMGFFILGGILLFLAKIVPLPEGLEAWIIVSLAALLMISYGVFVTKVPATRLRMDVAADNLYYLGFLYTLASLAGALAVDDPSKILNNFGVAITSTLIGIAARVSLSQLRVDPHDVEAASRLELADAASRIRAELDATVFQLSTFRTMNLQVMAEGYEEVRNHVDNTATEMFSSINKLIEKSEGPLQMLAAQATNANEQAIVSIEALTETSKGIAKANQKMVPQVDKATKALRELAEYYTDKGIIDDKMISVLKEEIDNIQTLVTREARDEFKNFTDATEKAFENNEAEQAKLAEISVDATQKSSLLTRLTKEATERIEKFQEQNMKTINAAIEKYSTSSKKIESAQEQFKEATQTDFKSINDKIETSIQAVEKLESQQSKMAEKTAEDIKTVSTEIKKHSVSSEKIESAQQQFKQETQTDLKSINDKIDSSLEKSSTSSKKIESAQEQFKEATQTDLKSINDKIDTSIQTSIEIEKNIKLVADEMINMKKNSPNEPPTEHTDFESEPKDA